MFNKLKLSLFVLMASGLMLSCADDAAGPAGPQGEQGEQGLPGADGPEGAPGVGGYYKLGWLEGNVKGTRRDGTAFEEAFKFEYTGDNMTGFREEEGKKYLGVYRGNSDYSNYLSLRLYRDSNNNFLPYYPSYAVEFRLKKELDANTLFMVDAEPYFLETESYITNISDEKNKLYNFRKSSNGKVYFTTSSYNGPATADEGVYYFENTTNNHDLYYSRTTGALVGIYNNEAREYIEEGDLFDLYNQIKYAYNNEAGGYVFYDVASGNSLHEVVPAIPADELTISNFTQDETSGVITFDYNIKISGKGLNSSRTNSTHNDLTITGSFNSGGKVYKNTAYRTKK